MAKFSLTESGVEAFTAQFYKFSDDKLQGEAILLAGDPRAYIITEKIDVEVYNLMKSDYNSVISKLEKQLACTNFEKGDIED